MAFQDGKLMRITVGGKEIFHEVSVSLSGGTEFKDVATKDTSGTESTPGSKSWTASVEGVASADSTTEHDLKAMVDLWNAQTLSAITVTDSVSGNIEFSGNAYIENWSVDAANEESVTFSYSLKGSGALTVGSVA
jgi:TP901-1 family phage major tail protein